MELFLKAGEAVNEPEDAEIRLTYSVSDGENEAATTTAQPGSVTLDVVDTPVSFHAPERPDGTNCAGK